MSSESRNEQTGEKGEEGIVRQRSESAEVEGHVRRDRTEEPGGEDERRPSHLTDDGPEVEGHVRRDRNEEPGGDDAWVGGRGEEGVRRD